MSDEAFFSLLFAAPSPWAMARLDLRELALPFRGILVSCFVADGAGSGKLVAPFPWPHRFDDHARVMALAPRRDDRVERAAPRAPENIDGSRRVRARGDRPEYFVDVGDIDIVVHDDYVAA